MERVEGLNHEGIQASWGKPFLSERAEEHGLYVQGTAKSMWWEWNLEWEVRTEWGERGIFYSNFGLIRAIARAIKRF